MYWIICGIIVYFLVKRFGMERTENIVVYFVSSVFIGSFVAFFIFFVLPSQFWKNL